MDLQYTLEEYVAAHQYKYAVPYGTKEDGVASAAINISSGWD